MARLSDRPPKSFEDFEEKPVVNKKQPVNEEIKEFFEYLSINTIVSDGNIRKTYNDECINELAESIKKYGQLQPISVYEKNQQFVIIFGHRRYLACKQAGLKEVKAILAKEPNSLDKIYQQVIENEQSENLSPEDREAYIKLLKDNGQPFEEIANKIGKSISWVRECSAAFNVRKNYQKILDDANLSLSTHETNLLRNAPKEEVEKAIALVVENPENKIEILKDVNKRNLKKKNVGAKKRNNFLLLSLDNLEINLDKKN